MDQERGLARGGVRSNPHTIGRQMNARPGYYVATINGHQQVTLCTSIKRALVLLARDIIRHDPFQRMRDVGAPEMLP